ncbi:MAG TPA: methylated-DNA--[protein]-cysteine S-methyltransferase [Methylomirabilota bacterium]|jgi:methylated-DNA-[protein]-cysteine S-methyltransferase
MLLIDEIASPLGRVAIAARAGRLCALEFGSVRLARQLSARYPDVPRRRARDPFGLSSRIRAYLAGDLAAVDRIRVETGGTRFQRRVWRALRRIPAGDTMTYGGLARALGHGAAARAVGAANGRNPISLVVPCHRLVGGDDSLTGYGGGLWRKRWLLHHEAARAQADRPRTASGPRTGRRR